MTKVKFSINIIGILIILVGCNSVSTETNNTVTEGNVEMTKGKVIKIAEKRLGNLGYDLELMEVKFSEKFDSNWSNEISNKDLNLGWEENPEMRNMLKNRGFWAILFAKQQPSLGGTVWFFIDSANGEIITQLRGK